MNNYHLKQTSKTKVLNVFRKLFTIPFFEKFLVSKTLGDSNFFKKLIPPDYLYRHGSIRNITRNGIRYKLDISNVVDHYLYFGIEKSDYDSILDTLRNAKVILDIGANIGTISLLFASINNKAKIIGFEPHPDTFKRAEENIRLNKFRNIQLINIGLGETKNILKLYEVNTNNPGMNRIIKEEVDLPFKSIHVNKLDTILSELKISNVDFIKIDVEGFEYAVLEGGKEILTDSKPILFIELDDNNLKENDKSALELVKLLLSFGYTIFYRADNLLPITLDSTFENCHFDLIARPI